MNKICHVVFDRFPNDSRVRRYANSLLERGWDVSVVCIGDGTDGTIEGVGKRLRIFRLPLKKRRSSFARRIAEYFVFEVYAFLMVTYIFLRHRVTTYHVHTLPDFLVFSCFVPRLFGARVILDFHELFPEFMMQHKPDLTKSSLLIRMILLQEKLSFLFATDIIAFHDPAEEILSSRIRSHKPITVVMNGVDAAELPEIHRSRDGKFRIVYNGTINFNLNLEIVVDALAAIRTNRCDVYSALEFDLYGEGPDLENILERARELQVDNVCYGGRHPFGEMMKKLGSASICVLPPRKDVYSDLYYSLKLTEMVYLRIPVIATRLNTYLRYFPEGCLLYFDSGDVQGLAAQICLAFDSQQEAADRAQRAWEQYQSYSWPIMKKTYLELIDKTILPNEGNTLRNQE